MTDGNGHTTCYHYDSVGNLLDERYPLNSGEVFDTDTYSYDNDGNVIDELDGRGVLKSYSRSDPESLVTGIYYSGFGDNGNVSPTAPVTFTYDNFGRRATMMDGFGSTSDLYDAIGNITYQSRVSTTGFMGMFGEYYPGNGNYYFYYPDNSLSSLSEDGNVGGNVGTNGNTFYSYDAAGRLTQISNPWQETWTHTYLANGWLQSTTKSGDVYPNKGPINQVNTVYGYNQRGFLTSLVNSGSYYAMNSATGFGIGATFGTLVAQPNISSYSGFSYDAVGNRLGYSANLPAVTFNYGYGSQNLAPTENYVSGFSYDTTRAQANQNRDVLTQETRNASVIGQFSYDAAYNDVPVNKDNQITSNNSTFDGQGNPSTYDKYPMTFDGENRLTSISGINGGTELFTYDGDGHRISKTVSGIVTNYFYSGDTLIREDTGVGTPNKSTIDYGYTADGLRSAGVYEYGYQGNLDNFDSDVFDFFYDPQGNVVQRTDTITSSIGAWIDNIYAYSAYGSLTSSVPVVPTDGYDGTVGETASLVPTATYQPTSVGFGGQ